MPLTHPLTIQAEAQTRASKFLNNNPPHLFSKRLINGTVDGNMNVDGSVTPVVFKLAPVTGEVLHISRLLFYVQDGGSFDAVMWGNGLTLTNGFDIGLSRNGVYRSLLSDYPILTTGDVAAISFDTEVRTWGTGDNIMVARLSFTKFGGAIRLDGDNNDELHFTVRDDITLITRQYLTAQGFIEEDY